jgi:hypothetical protein
MMDDEDFARLRRLSEKLCGNNFVLPVAAAAQAFSGTISTPTVAEELGGRIPSNRIQAGLERLRDLGAVRELPYPGRPHPRLYEVEPGPFWDLVGAWTGDRVADVVST